MITYEWVFGCDFLSQSVITSRNALGNDLHHLRQDGGCWLSPFFAKKLRLSQFSRTALRPAFGS